MSADDHGSASTYTNWGCRCEPCKQAHTIEFDRMRRNRAARLIADPTLAEHGTVSTYTNWACRCDQCVAAGSRHRRLRSLRP